MILYATKMDAQASAANNNRLAANFLGWNNFGGPAGSLNIRNDFAGAGNDINNT